MGIMGIMDKIGSIVNKTGWVKLGEMGNGVAVPGCKAAWGDGGD